MTAIALPQPAVRRTAYRAAPRAVAPPLRLTARGRIVVLAVALAVIGALIVMFGSSVAATVDPPAQTVTTVTVQPGQSLWSIAAEARPDADIRQTVDQIIRLNALPDGAPLAIGATLAIPAGR